MSIKNLFGKTVTSYEDVAKDVESTDFIDEVVAKRETYLPPIDFSDPANFVFYGSAELYYEAAIKRIYEDYPYDGSKAEQIDFEEKSSFLERWLFENKYPKTTGHIELGTTGMLTTLSGVYRGTSVPEYIRVWGGLHTGSASSALDYQLSNSAVYDEANNRTQNFNCDFETGVTVEFWMKKDSTTANEAEVILDLWNGSSTTTNSRMIVEFAEFASKQYIRLRLLKNATTQTKIFELTSFATGTWFHFAVSLIEEDGALKAKSYVDGVKTLSTNFASTYTFEGKMDAFIGAMQTNISGIGATGSGKFQGYLDEFRFWKTRRTSRQIKLNWFREIGGGANTDDNTSDLGVYLKFNEGITGNTAIDSTVLDYSGRLANGTWIGYPGSSARSTDSAMNAAGYTEAPSPIIYSNHPDVTALEAEMTLSGSDYDSGRGQAFYRSLPNWLVEDDTHEGDQNLRKISHILSSYMDTLRVQIDSLSKLQDKQYVAEAYKATPFAAELLKNKGFTTSEMFLSAEVFETFSNINYDHGQYDLNIDEIKNLIFTNIYNNLENIYNTKGTEKSIRNLIRCFGIDDELIKLNQYTDGGTQYLGDKYRSTSVKKKYINLNDPDRFESTMYQSGSLTFISGALEASVGAFTLEADILVPHKKKLGENGFFGTPFLSASIMGFHEADPTDASDFTWSSDGAAEARDLQVYLVRDSNMSDHAKFVVKNQSETIYATSSYVYDIYNNEHYNVALRIKPQTYPYAGSVTNATPDYDIELYAVSHNFDELKEEVLISATVDNATGSAYLQRPKRIYAGAHRQDFTGSYLHRTDLQFGRVSAWLDYLPNSSIQEHNKDVLNYGNHKSIDGATAFAIDDVRIPSMDLSILNWDFDTVTVSDGSGEFVIEDTTTGSSDTIYGWVDNIIRREHDGKGEFFPTESSAFLENEFLYANKKQLPETSFNTNNIFIKGDEEINFGEDDDISDNLFVLEKSPAAIVSEEMLNLFSTTQEFSNLFGRHVDRYRIEYKDIAKARQLFYQRANTGLDFDKFFTYFKWIDQSISEMINQLIPASVNFAGGVVDVIEPHILERDKYQRRVGLLQTVTSTEASIRGVQEMNYNWRIGHAPIPLDDTTNSLWQKERSERDTTEQQAISEVITTQVQTGSFERSFLSGSNGTYEGRAYATRRFSRPVRPAVEFNDSIHGGTNYEKAKDRDFLRSVIGLHSDLGPSGAPKNVVTFGAGPDYGLNYEEALKAKDAMSPSKKIKIPGFGLVGKFTEFAAGYQPLSPDLDFLSRRKMSHMFIGNIISGSVTTGYNSKINNSVVGGGYRPGVNLVNLHSDTTDITNEIPIQGPFTERWIGGHQHRHVALNSVGKPERFTPGYTTNDLDHEFSRPEGWRLLIGKNPLVITAPGTPSVDDDGAIGFTAPDYGIGQDGNWPDEDRLYAIYYREERAKRPVNIKNIQTLTSSVYHGNYQHEYEVMSTFGDQGYFLKRAGNLLPDTIATTLPETTNYHTLVAQDTSVSGNYFGAGNNRQYEGIVETPISNAYFSFEFDQTQNPEDAIDTFSLTIERENYIPNSSNDDTRKIIFSFDLSATNGSVSRTADHIQVDVEVVSGDWTSSLSNFEAAAVIADIQPYLSLVVLSAGSYRFEEAFLLGDDGNGGAISSDPGMFSALDSTFTAGSSSYSYVANITSTQDRSTGSAHVIRTRFSAPGGPEVNSSGYLDVATQQYSVHNSINFRNLTTRGSGSGEDGTMRVVSHSNRREGLRTLRSRHQGQFGIDSQHGAISATDYNAEASYHKQHRNNQEKITAVDKVSNAIQLINNNTQFLEMTLNGAEGALPPSTTSMSLSFWYKANSNASSTSRAIFQVTDSIRISLQTNTVTSKETLTVNLKDSGALGYKNASIEWNQSSLSNPITKWNHYIISFNFSSILTIEATINGVTSDSTSFSLGDFAGQFAGISSGASFYLSDGLGITGGTQDLDGAIMNLSYFDSFISQSPDDLEVLRNHEKRDDITKISSLIGFWALGKDSGLTTGDTIPDGASFSSLHGIVKSPFVATNPGPSSDLFIAEGFYAYIDGERQGDQRFDNDHFHSLLPASDFQYSWINNALSGSNSSGVTWASQQRIIDFAPRNGVVAVRGEGYVPALVFPTISDVSCCFDFGGISITVDYNTEGGVNTLTEDATLQVVGGLANDTNEISQIHINDMDMAVVYSGCCDDNDLTYRVTADDGIGDPFDYDTGYQTTPQSPPSNIIHDDSLDNPGTIILTFYAKDCEGNIETLVVTLEKAKFDT